MSDPQSYWQDLAAAALVGTARRPALPAPPPGPLAELLGRIERAEPAGALLAAAAATTYVRAGALPSSALGEGFPPCPVDEQPPCGPRAARHLAALLGGDQRPLLPEWLAALAASGRVAPHSQLPQLLELARSQAELRPLIRPALGQRGHWLATLNPAWANLATPEISSPEDVMTTWETGSQAARQSLIRTLRASEPARARELIEAVWASEKADERQEFLELLRAGLSMADEPFLEAALDDRSKGVRFSAADLLVLLPASRLAQRMAARALALLRFSSGKRSLLNLMSGPRPQIEVSMPEACDKAMQRDGITAKPPQGMGERAWWLSQIIQRCTPSVWIAAWGVAPAAILGAQIPPEWRGLLVQAWLSAAVAHRDLAWAVALADLAGDAKVNILKMTTLTELALTGDAPVRLEQVIGILPQEQREPLLIAMLDRPLGHNRQALDALRLLPGPWGRELGRAVIASLARRLAHLSDNDARADWQLRAALSEFALAIPPELADSAAQALPADLEAHEFWREQLRAFAERLQLRREMLTALREDR